MKLYNRTHVPDDILTSLLVKSGRSVGANTSGVVVQVNPARSYGIRGMAYECYKVRMSKRWVTTDGGYYKITLPRNAPDSIEAAQSFLLTARHEWGHIRDYQAGGRWSLPFARHGRGGRRQEHDSRPEEIRANDYIFESDKRLPSDYFDDVILDLAIALDGLKKSESRDLSDLRALSSK